MGEIIIQVPQNFHKEYRVSNLAVIKELLASLETKAVQSQPNRPFNDEWRRKLLSMSVWSEDDIQSVKNARRYINRWRPRPLS